MISFKNKYHRSTVLTCCSVSAVLMGLAVLSSCSDWDDHYEANKSATSTQGETLLQNIEKNGQLTQFADLLKKTGYDKNLAASQTFTVWAPKDGSFDYNKLQGYDSERLQREFVENHIARNNYPASGAFDMDVYMLNEKRMHFGGTTSYDIQGVKLTDPNLSSSNGVMHLIDGQITYLSNIYESLNNYDEYKLDSISKFIHSFDEKEIDEEKSERGPVVDGQQTYLDTVYNERNEMLEYIYGVEINSEDSSYTMVVPTNDAWNKALDSIYTYVNYLPEFDFVSDLEKKTTERIKLKDAEAMKDSVAKVYMLGGLFFNNNLYDNKKLKNADDAASLGADSLVSTTGFKMYAEDATSLLTGAKRVNKSNGAIWVTDTLRMPTWTVWNPEIRLEAEFSTYWAGYAKVNNQPNVVHITQQNEEVAGSISRNYYIEVEPESRTVNPEMYFYLPEVRSTEYSIYVVFVPGNIASKHFQDPLKKNRLECTIGFADETGKTKEVVFKDIETNVDSVKTADGMTAKIDTCYIGDVTFPVSYLGMSSLSDIYAPYMKLRSRVSSNQTATYDRWMRIDCIILRPKKMDAYLKEHPDYKYDKGLY